MVEWFKAAVLKTAVAQVTEGSNPSLSANDLQQFPAFHSSVSTLIFVMGFEGGIEERPEEKAGGLRCKNARPVNQ